jgi:hypothetical protein
MHKENRRIREEKSISGGSLFESSKRNEDANFGDEDFSENKSVA